MLNIRELNPCDATMWLTTFKTLPVYFRLTDQYHHVIASYKEMTFLKAALNDTVYINGREFCEQYKILDCVPYYYIEKIMQNNPSNPVDIGCGLNVFKKAYPNICGLDADPNANFDVFDFFDEDFARGHQHCYDALISINAIHFSPINTITQRLKMINSIVKPGGKAFVSFNLETWLMYTDKETINQLFGPIPKFDDAILYVNKQIQNSELNFEIIDWPILRLTSDSTIRDDLNGNIRLVFTCD